MVRLDITYLSCVKRHRSNNQYAVRSFLLRGFTMIELMIVIAIAVVLITLTIPLNFGYKIRIKITECINNTALVKFAISKYRQTYGDWPPTLEATWETNPKEIIYLPASCRDDSFQ